MPPPLDRNRSRSASAGLLQANNYGPATSTAGGPAFSNGVRALSIAREDWPNDRCNEANAYQDNNGFGAAFNDDNFGLDEQRAGSPIPQRDEFALPLDGDAMDRNHERQSTPRAQSESQLPTPPNSAEQAAKAAKVAAAAKRKRAKKAAATIKDERITLDYADVQRMTAGYLKETSKANEKAEERRYALGEHKRARAMIGGIPRAVGAQELQECESLIWMPGFCRVKLIGLRQSTRKHSTCLSWPRSHFPVVGLLE